MTMKAGGGLLLALDLGLISVEWCVMFPVSGGNGGGELGLGLRFFMVRGDGGVYNKGGGRLR